MTFEKYLVNKSQKSMCNLLVSKYVAILRPIVALKIELNYDFKP